MVQSFELATPSPIAGHRVAGGKGMGSAKDETNQQNSKNKGQHDGK
ncbi:hypothetical protein [Mesorhizobium sp. M0130]